LLPTPQVCIKVGASFLGHFLLTSDQDAGVLLIDSPNHVFYAFAISTRRLPGALLKASAILTWIRWEMGWVWTGGYFMLGYLSSSRLRYAQSPSFYLGLLGPGKGLDCGLFYGAVRVFIPTTLHYAQSLGFYFYWGMGTISTGFILRQR
jgi:hypothetical protein